MSTSYLHSAGPDNRSERNPQVHEDIRAMGENRVRVAEQLIQALMIFAGTYTEPELAVNEQDNVANIPTQAMNDYLSTGAVVEQPISPLITENVSFLSARAKSQSQSTEELRHNFDGTLDGQRRSA